MTHWNTPLGDARINRALKLANLDHTNLEQRRRIELETSTTPPTIRGATAGGDQRKLRGIPAIGRGVTGAIPNTIPHAIH